VTDTASPALDHDASIIILQHDDRTGLAHVDSVLELSLSVLEPRVARGVETLSHEHGVDTARDGGLTGSDRVGGHADDRARRTVLGHEASSAAGDGEDEDSLEVAGEGSVDGGTGKSLGGLVHLGVDVGDGAEVGVVRDGGLGFLADDVHHGDGLSGVVTLGGLTGEHDAVSAIHDSVGYIRDFGAGGTRVVGHRLEHLRGADDGLAEDVALGDDHLLSEEDLLDRDLNTEVTTSDHDTIGFTDDFIEAVDTLLVLDLGDNLDAGAALTKHLSDLSDGLRRADEGGEDEVDTVLHTPLQVADVLRGD